MPSGSKKAAARPAGGESGAIVVAWNQEPLHIVQTPGAQPPTIHPTRSFAILHAAIYDSVVSITQDGHPYLVSVPVAGGARAPRVDAAPAQSGHDTLAALYPKWQVELDRHLSHELAGHADRPASSGGIKAGQT